MRTTWRSSGWTRSRRMRSPRGPLGRQPRSQRALSKSSFPRTARTAVRSGLDTPSHVVASVIVAIAASSAPSGSMT
eukprot:1551661-Heterocapsa_arctica.AAC.1